MQRYASIGVANGVEWVHGANPRPVATGHNTVLDIDESMKRKRSCGV